MTQKLLLLVLKFYGILTFKLEKVCLKIRPPCSNVSYNILCQLESHIRVKTNLLMNSA